MTAVHCFTLPNCVFFTFQSQIKMNEALCRAALGSVVNAKKHFKTKFSPKLCPEGCLENVLWDLGPASGINDHFN